MNINDNEFHHLSTYIHAHYGINLSSKRILVEGRLAHYLSERGFSDFGQYIQCVLADRTGNENAILLNKLTTNHTFFMREAEHYNYFLSTALPHLVSTIKDRDIRIWSAGCSSGEEPYTLAMIIHQYLAEKKAAWDTKILATDISQKVLDTAKEGIYPTEALKNVPSIWKLNYFSKINEDVFQISRKIKEDIIFRWFNLMNEVFPFKRKFHVIFCRNVMIYFDQKTKTELVNKFYQNTEMGGYLFIGHSEAIDKEITGYKSIIPALYQKVR